MQCIGFKEEFDVAALRDRLRKMGDAELLKFGKAVHVFAVRKFGQPPGEVFMIQLKEAKAEWSRRNHRTVE